MNGQGFEVPALSRMDIRRHANLLRRLLGIRENWFDIVDLAERVLPEIMGLDFQILEVSRMGENHGETLPDERVMRIRNDVYEGACRGQGRDRFTIAHEVGHLFLHVRLPFARRLGERPIKTYMNSEWQANTYAGELLCTPVAAKRGADEMAKQCGVTLRAAEVQHKVYAKDGLL